MSFKIVPFVLHDHNAHRAGRHYDFRIKYPDRYKLKSFAIPKGILPTKPGEKSLAVNTPDHPMNWLTIETEIPEGEYGAGTISIIQTGKAEVSAWTDSKITFIIHGYPLNGRYTLVKFLDKNKNSRWLLIKGKN